MGRAEPHEPAGSSTTRKAGRQGFHPTEAAAQRLLVMSSLQKYSACAYRFERCHGSVAAAARWDPRTPTVEEASLADELNLYKED